MTKDEFEEIKNKFEKLKERKYILENFKNNGNISCYIERGYSPELYEDMMQLWEKHIKLLQEEIDRL